MDRRHFLELGGTAVAAGTAAGRTDATSAAQAIWKTQPPLPIVQM